MGLFNGYLKPGRGIEKDAPKKKGIFRYFEIFFRKIWKIWKLNMLTFIASLPFMVIMFFIAPVNSDSFLIKILGDISETEIVLQILTLRSFFAVTAFTILGSGPASAAYAYITRCFTREEHSWIWSDFKDKFKENFKQGMILTVLDIVLSYLLINGLYFYSMQYLNTSSSIWLVFVCVMFLLTVMFVFMNLHAYQMMVTFSSSTVQLLKNSLLFSLAQLPMNVLLLIIGFAINLLVFTFTPTLFAIIFSFLLTASLVRFPIEYSSARAIEKKLLANMQKSETSEDKGEE